MAAAPVVTTNRLRSDFVPSAALPVTGLLPEEILKLVPNVMRRLCSVRAAGRRETSTRNRGAGSYRLIANDRTLA